MSSAIKTPAFQAKASNILNEDNSSIYSGGAWSFKNASAVTGFHVASDGNVGIGTSSSYSSLVHTKYGAMVSFAGFNNNTARPTISGGTQGPYEIRGVGQNQLGDDGFLMLSAGAGTNASTKSYIAFSGYSQIPDMDRSIVFGTSGTERMRIDADGKVGVGTTSPGAKLHVTGSVKADSGFVSAASGITTILSADASGSYLETQGANNQRFFTNGAERMRIDASGNVTLGAAGSTATHTLRGSAVDFIATGGSQLNLHNANTRVKVLFISTTGDRFYIRDADNTDGVYLAQNGTSWQSASDERLKKNIKPLELGLEQIKALKPARFDFNTDESEEAARVGFIAQEVLPVLPHAVDVSEDPEGMMGVSPTEMIPVLVKAIQELSAQVEELKAKLP